jgi:hypothetical protein
VLLGLGFVAQGKGDALALAVGLLLAAVEAANRAPPRPIW